MLFSDPKFMMNLCSKNLVTAISFINPQNLVLALSIADFRLTETFHELDNPNDLRPRYHSRKQIRVTAGDKYKILFAVNSYYASSNGLAVEIYQGSIHRATAVLDFVDIRKSRKAWVHVPEKGSKTYTFRKSLSILLDDHLTHLSSYYSSTPR